MTERPLKLPGKLGDANLTLVTDPRLDPRVAAYMDTDAIIGEAEDMIAAGEAGSEAVSEMSLEALYAMLAQSEETVDVFQTESVKDLPPVTGVRRRREAIEGVDKNEIALFIHEPEERVERLPGLVHMHGGGMAMASTTNAHYMRWRDELAATGMVVVGVEFRNSAGKLGNYPFPAGLNDCASAVQWAYRNREDLGARGWIVWGDSGGGNLCLATALKANREGWIDQIAGVYATCPFIATGIQPSPPELVSMVENDLDVMGSSSAVCARAYDPTGEHAHNPLAWPYAAEKDDLAGLPPHVISVNELDVLRDEGIGYARKLWAAGVSAVCRTVHGTGHGNDTDFPAVVPDLHAAILDDVVAFVARVTS